MFETSPQTPAPPERERTQWRCVKGAHTAEARVLWMADGLELRIAVGAQVVLTSWFRKGEAVKVAALSAGVCDTFTAEGWVLQPVGQADRA